MPRKIISEALGSMLIVMATLGATIQFEIVLGSEGSVSLLANAIVVAFVLAALIECFAPISGAHFNPLITMIRLLDHSMKPKEGLCYVLAQIIGGVLGIFFTHLMFANDLDHFMRVSSNERNGFAYVGEFFAAFILILVVLLLVQRGSKQISLMVGLLVGGQIIATSSTNFANPQVTIARIFTDTPSGIRPFDALIFIVMQVLGALVAYIMYHYVFRGRTTK